MIFSQPLRERGPLEPSLAADERVLLNSPGGYREHVRSGWKLGRLYLTNRRLRFLSQTSVLFETLLSQIQDIKVERQRYVAGMVKEVVAIRYQPATRLATGRAFLITPDLEALRNGLYETVLPELDEGAIELVAGELDDEGREGRAILSHLWGKGAATTQELAKLIGAPSPLDVLLSIRERINPAAERILGCPLVVFDPESANNDTGKKGPLGWRLIKRKGRWEQEPLVPFLDVLDEGSRLDVFIELPGVKEGDILLGVGRERLIVSVEGENRRYRAEIPLPSQVSTEKLTRTYNNDILVVSLQKLDEGHRHGP